MSHSPRWTKEDLIRHNLKHGICNLTEGDFKKPSKYRNKIVTWNDLTFDSTKERNRYIELTLKEKEGIITNLQRQKEFSIQVNGHHICSYIADAVYIQNGNQVVEDTKSRATRKIELYILKKKLMKILLNIEIIEV